MLLLRTHFNCGILLFIIILLYSFHFPVCSVFIVFFTEHFQEQYTNMYVECVPLIKSSLFRFFYIHFFFVHCLHPIVSMIDSKERIKMKIVSFNINSHFWLLSKDWTTLTRWWNRYMQTFFLIPKMIILQLAFYTQNTGYWICWYFFFMLFTINLNLFRTFEWTTKTCFTWFAVIQT